jgi:hypothetical protein
VDRSLRDYAVIHKLIEARWTRDEIVLFYMLMPCGVLGKMADTWRDGEAYLHGVIDNCYLIQEGKTT